MPDPVDFPAFQALAKRYPNARAGALLRRMEIDKQRAEIVRELRFTVCALRAIRAMELEICRMVEEDVRREMARADVEAQFEVG